MSKKNFQRFAVSLVTRQHLIFHVRIEISNEKQNTERGLFCDFITLSLCFICIIRLLEEITASGHMTNVRFHFVIIHHHMCVHSSQSEDEPYEANLFYEKGEQRPIVCQKRMNLPIISGAF